jgi:DNA polymerase I-like protein with 3'-5' exonuclease and polymerase domains
LQTDRISASYEHALQCVYNKIAKRGLLMDVPRLNSLNVRINDEIVKLCDTISQSWNCHVYVGAKNSKKQADEVNLNSTSGEKALITKLKKMGFNVPTVRKKNRDTGDSEAKDSTAELPLRRLFAETQDANISHILRVRELTKMASTYCAANLHNDVFYSSYNVAATVTGRRGSRKHIFGYGGNAQNFPKHTDLSEEFRQCIVCRPSKIYFSVDQISAEDFPVNALAMNQKSLDELMSGVDRHTKLAAFIFSKPEASIDREGIERYMGKKARHASNYGMRGQRFSDVLATEGFPIPKKTCDDLLLKVAQYDPSIESVFHQFIRDEISRTRLLRTPFGRERFFLGFRPNDANYELYNEAYSYIPQSTVGDNTGFAVMFLDRCNDYVVQESHDSVIQECPDRKEDILDAYRKARESFDRDIRFDNGFNIKIPIEGELGYTFGTMKKIKKTFTEQDVLDTWEQVREEKFKTAVAAN